MKTQFSSRMLLVASVFVIACDNMDEALDAGFVPEEARAVRLVTATDKSTVMDVKQMFRDVKGVDLASSGDLHVNYINDRYVRFNDVVAKTAEFSFGVLHTNNSRTEVDVILSRQDGAFTHASMTNKEVLVVNLLNSPEFKGFDPLAKSAIIIDANRPGDNFSNTRNLVIEASSIANVGNVATVRYAPPAGFVGQVRFRYYVTIDVEGHSATCNLPDAPEYHTEHDVVIDVAN